MKNINLMHLDKHENQFNYELVDVGIYKDLHDEDDTKYRMAVSYELEESEDSQYPLEEVLNKFHLYVSDFIANEDKVGNVNMIELGGELADITAAKVIIGKRVYNRDYEDDGNTYVKLVIE